MESITKVYCHTNKVNGKKYIGMTRLDIRQRVGKDGNGYKESTVFNHAINKYGWNNFHTEILKSDMTHDEAEGYERYAIKKHNTMVPNGYNLQSGGGANRTVSEETRRKISEGNMGKVMTPEHIELLREINTGKVVSEETREKLRQANLGKRLTEDHKEAISRGLLQNEDRGRNGVSIEQYDLEGNHVSSWGSASIASRETGYDRRSIAKCCNRQQYTSNGYIWRFTGDESIDIEQINKYGRRKERSVEVYTLDDEFVGRWETYADLAKDFGVHESTVSNNIRHRRSTFIGEYILRGDG